MNTFADCGDVLVCALSLELPLLTGAACLWLVRKAGRSGRPQQAGTVILGNLFVLGFLLSLLDHFALRRFGEYGV